MRALAPLVVLSGCRGLLGIEDPTIADGGLPNPDGTRDGTTSCGVNGPDWDADGIPDDCDRCPMIAGMAGDLDADGDLIGDACDPQPNNAGDKRLVWEPFSSPAAITGWTTVGGMWSVGSSRLEQADTASTARIGPPGARGNVFLQTEIVVKTLGFRPYAGFCAYVGGNDFKCCDVLEPTGPVLSASTNSAMNQTAWSGMFTTGEQFVLTNKATDATHRCDVTQGSSRAFTTQSGLGTAGLVALHTREMAASYRYLWIVQMAP